MHLYTATHHWVATVKSYYILHVYNNSGVSQTRYSSWLYRQHKYSSSAIVRAVRVSKSNARSTSQEDNSGIHINGIGMMMAAMGMQYSTHEIQQQLVLLHGHELCLD